MSVAELSASIDKYNDFQLERFVRAFYPKVAALGKILHIDMTKEDSIRDVIHNIMIFHYLWDNSKRDLEDQDIKDSCIELLKRMTGESITNLRDALTLSKEIMDEMTFKLKTVGGDSI